MSYLLGVCPCRVKLEGADIEARLRAHVAQAHPEAFHDDDGLVLIERVEATDDWTATMYEAWQIVKTGVPVLVSER